MDLGLGFEVLGFGFGLRVRGSNGGMAGGFMSCVRAGPKHVEPSPPKASALSNPSPKTVEPSALCKVMPETRSVPQAQQTFVRTMPYCTLEALKKAYKPYIETFSLHSLIRSSIETLQNSPNKLRKSLHPHLHYFMLGHLVGGPSCVPIEPL